MLFLLFAQFLQFANALNYKAGETFSYTYQTSVETFSSQEGADDNKVNFDVSCTANFKVLSVTDESANMQLVISNAKGVVAQADEKKDMQSDDLIQQYLSLPISFTIFDNATITDVVADKTDSSEIVTFKTSVVFSLRAHLDATEENSYTNDARIDNLGLHKEFVRLIKGEQTNTIETSFTENDFDQFENENVNAEVSGIDVKTSHVVSSNRILSATGSTTLIMNKKAQSNDGANGDAPIKMISQGSFTLSNYVAGPFQAVNPSSEMVSSKSFLAANSNKVLVPHLHPSYYSSRVLKAAAPLSDPVPESCPGSIDFCRTVSKSWDAGNSNVGITLAVSAMAGITLGCKEEQRTYMAGAYGSIDLKILSNPVNAVYAYAEFGLVDGSPLRNAVEATVFGNSVFKKEFPWNDCIKHTWNIGSWSHNWEFPFTWRIYIFELQLILGADLSFSLDLTATICILDLKAQIQLIPQASVALSASAAISVYAARAGLSLTGSAADHLNPTVYVDGNTCRVGFYVYNTLEGIDVTFSGWFQVVDVKGSIFHFRREWGSKHSVDIWNYHFDGREDKIVDIYWGAK